MMKITPLDIRERQFKLRFRGFDVREVDSFLEEIANTVKMLIQSRKVLEDKISALQTEIREYREREVSLTRALQRSHSMLDSMKENAQKSADLIVSEAEVRAERILNRAHNRLAQLHEDIAELKRQRIQIEVQVRSVIEGHSKLLDAAKEEMNTAEEEYSKLKFLKKAP